MFVNHHALKQADILAVHIVSKKSMRLETSVSAQCTLYPIYVLFALGLPDYFQNAGIPFLHCNCP